MSTPSTINRRGFLKTAGILALVAAMHTPFAFGQDAIGQEPGTLRKPNILLIYADDLGWSDVGYQGEGLFLTPHIDRLAREGVVFSSGYAAAPNCGPSRSSIMSGGYTHRHGMFSQGRGSIWGPHNQMRLVQVKSQTHLAPSIVTVAEALKGAGYATGHFGKWQLAARHIPGSSPLEQGFDVAFHTFDDEGRSGIKGEGIAGWGTARPGPPHDPAGVYTLTDKAVEFMTANRNRPFFVYLSFPDIHFPFMTPDDPPYFQPGQQYGFPRSDREPKNRRLGPHDGSPDLQRVVHRMIEEMDTGVGRVIDTLKACGRDRDTFVFFTSDNGGYIDYRGLNRGQISDMGPLRGQKGDLYEGGHRVPAIAWHPGRVPPGKVCDATALTFDLHPTFLELAGLNPPLPGNADSLDGVSLLPLLYHGKPIAERAVAWFHGPRRALRKGAWKLVQNGDGAPELYNLDEDIGETTNRMSEFPTLGNALLKELQALERDVKGRNE